MAENSDLTTASILRDDLAACIDLTQQLDEQIACTSAQDQVKVESTISKLESMTIKVSQLGVFSENENLEELSTHNLRFLMLPALLGCLTEKLGNCDRRTNLDRVEVYTKDFIVRLKSYGILPHERYEFDADSTENGPSASVQPSAGINAENYLKNSIKNRDEKVKLYCEQLAFKEKYEILSKACSNCCEDEEKLREFYLVELNFWARKMYEFLCNLQREKPILDHMAKLKSGEIKPEKQENKPTVQPLILMRSRMQKDVLGLGYPSRPSMTVDEFYEKKIREGHMQLPGAEHKAEGMSEEDEKVAKEWARDNDDSDLILSERNFDEYKDDHRTGWGNTHNKG